MARNLGFLTAYGLEDIYDFIGESKINLKIKEYESRPTMGIRLENFVGAYYSFTEGEDKGPLWVMQTFLSSWFRNDFDLPLFFFLYEK